MNDPGRRPVVKYHMQILRSDPDPSEFLEKLPFSNKKLLLLDYDGTLAPFKSERDRAFPYEGVKELLEKILDHKDCRTIIISGRPAGDIVKLLNFDKPPEIWGCHGWERLFRDGNYISQKPGDKVQSALDKAYGLAMAEGLGDRLEKKAVSVALHWRGLDAQEKGSLEKAARDLWNPLASQEGLEMMEFNGGIEIRPTAIDKGTTVKTVIREYGADAAAAYLGDDRTDEDAFQAIEGCGIGVLVSERLHPTSASIWLKPPGELLWFLETWSESLGEIDE